MMKLRPSEIFFSQDSIANNWGKRTPCNVKFIGETLDELLTKSISLRDIPNITSVLINGKFYSVDNRRLWVFRKAEELGFLDDIEFDHDQQHFNLTKFTTTNGGISIRIRGSGDPGGQIWRTWKPKTFQKVHENTVSNSAYRKIYAIEHRKNVNAGYFCTKTVSEYQDSGTYKSSHCKNYYSRPSYRFDNANSRNFESPVSDKKGQFSCIIRSKAGTETTKCGQLSRESTIRNNSLHVQGPPVYQNRSRFNQNVFVNKHASDAKHPRTLISYSDNLSSKHDFRSYNEFLGKWESPVLDNEIHDPIIKRSPAEEKQTRCKSSLESISRKTASSVQGSLVNQRSTSENQHSFGIKTVAESKHLSTYKSYNDYIFVKPDVRSYDAFSGKWDSPASDVEIHHSIIKRSPPEEKQLLRSNTSIGKISSKTKSCAKGHECRTYVNQDSIGNKKVSDAQHPNTYKSSYTDYISAKTDFLCDNDFSSNSESSLSAKRNHRLSIQKPIAEEDQTQRTKSSFESSTRKTALSIHGPYRSDLVHSRNFEPPPPDREIQLTSIIRSQAGKEETQCSKSYHETSLRKNAIHFHVPPENQSRSSVNQCFVFKKHEAQHPSAFQAYNEFISTKPDVRSYKEFSSNCEPPVPDKEINRSIIKRSPALEEPKRKSKSSLDSILYKTPLRVDGQRRSVYIPSYIDNLSAKHSGRWVNDLSRTCEYPKSDKDIHYSSIKGSTVEKEPTLKNKSSLRSTRRKTSPRFQGPPANQSRSSVNQCSVFKKHEAQHPSTFQSYNVFMSAKPDVLSNTKFSSNCDSPVSDKEIHRSILKRSPALEEPTRRSKSSLDSILYKTSLSVKGHQRRTNVDHHSIGNTTIIDAQNLSAYTPSCIHNISAKPDVRWDNDLSSNCEYPDLDKEIYHSIINRSTVEKEPTLKSKSSLGSTRRKTSPRVQGPPPNQSRSSVNQCSVFKKHEAQHPSTFQSYNIFISAKPDDRSNTKFSSNCDSPVSDK